MRPSSESVTLARIANEYARKSLLATDDSERRRWKLIARAYLLTSKEASRPRAEKEE